MSLSKQKYRSYLSAHKAKQYPTAPATTQEYIQFWETALLLDLKESVASGGFQMHFHPFQKDGPLLVLDKAGKIPEKYSKKLAAYPTYGLDLGLNVVVESYTDKGGGQLVSVKITPHDKPISNHEL